jgi:hypothetical protein
MEDIVRMMDDFRHRAQDYCDNPSDQAAVGLRGRLQDVFNEAKARKAPDYLFEHVKEIESMVQGLKNTEGIFSPADVDDMYDRCQDLKKKLRELSAEA